jgi:hypothetical protein
MQYYHVNPEEAFKIHEDVGAYNSVGIHWGTFKLTNEVNSYSFGRIWGSRPRINWRGNIFLMVACRCTVKQFSKLFDRLHDFSTYSFFLSVLVTRHDVRITLT